MKPDGAGDEDARCRLSHGDPATARLLVCASAVELERVLVGVHRLPEALVAVGESSPRRAERGSTSRSRSSPGQRSNAVASNTKKPALIQWSAGRGFSRKRSTRPSSSRSSVPYCDGSGTVGDGRARRVLAMEREQRVRGRRRRDRRRRSRRTCSPSRSRHARGRARRCSVSSPVSTTSTFQSRRQRRRELLDELVACSPAASTNSVKPCAA